jgi:protein-S-isoprenylcysteine O-methyltransferase Ste14
VSSRPGQNKTNANVKVQPPLLVMIHVAVAFLLARFVSLPLIVLPILQVIGFPLVILGFLIGIGAMMAFQRARAIARPHDLPARLVTSGVYRFSRNPVYLGFLLILVGLPLDIGSYWGILLGPVLIFLFNRLVIEPEETLLAQKFGDEYRSYKSKVRRWI